MNYEQLIAETEANCKFGGYSDVQPPPDWAAAVNQAYREITTETEYNAEDTTFSTVIGQAEYNLISDGPAPTDLRDWIRITDVLWGTMTRIEQADEVQIRRYDLLWTQAENSQPSFWWSSKPNTLRFWAPPASVETINVHGSRELGPLVAGGVPTFPVRYHLAIPLRAAWIVLKRSATGGAYQRAQAYLKESEVIIGKFKGELQDQRTAVFLRKQVRRSSERLILGGPTFRRY